MRNLLAAFLILRGLVAVASTVHPEIPVTPTELVPTRNVLGSHLASNGETYLAVWTDLRSVPGATYASRLRVDGTLLDRVGIRVADHSYAGGVVWSGDAFVIAYLQAGTVKVRTLTPEGVLGEPVALFTTDSPASQVRMRMATNGDSVLLVTSDSMGALLDPDGQERREIDFGWKFNGGFGVAAAGSTYLVAAPRFNIELKTQIVTADGDLGETDILMDTVRFGVDVASDGNRFLVAWARGNLYAQYVGVDGEAIDAPIALTNVPNVNAGSHSLTRLIRRGDEYVIVYQDGAGEPSATLRLGNDGEKRGPLLEHFTGVLTDIAVQNGHGAVLTRHAQVLSATFFDAGAPAALRNPTPVSLTGKEQTDVQLARIDGGFATVWRADATVPEIFLSHGPGSTPVLVVSGYATPFDVVVESGVIWVFWLTSEGADIYTRRFTDALEPIDAEPFLVTDDGSGYYSVAAGGGAVVFVQAYPQGPFGSEPMGAHVEARVLHAGPAGITMTSVAVASPQGYDRLPAIEWNGSSFTIAWANATDYLLELRRIATNDRSQGIKPDDRILAVHMTAAGEVLESTPAEVAVSKHLDALSVVNGIAVWQTYDSVEAAVRRHTYAARVTAGATVADLGGENTFFGAVAAEGGGFLLTRALPVDATTIMPELVTVDASLSITGTVALPAFTVDFFYDDINPYDVDLLGGPARLIGYSRIAAEVYGHEHRVFVRRIGETHRRRALR